MNKAKVMQKTGAGEGLTVAEIKVYQKTVKPEKPPVRSVGNSSGITNEDLNDKSPISDLLSDFLKYIGSETVVDHNVEFDLKFINVALKNYNLPPIKNKTVDIYALAKEKCELESYELCSIAEALKISKTDGFYPEIVFRVYEKLKNVTLPGKDK